MSRASTPDELPPRAHRAAVRCAATAEEALAFLADGRQLGRWALGCWDTEDCGAGVVRGHSLFDGEPAWVRPVADAAARRVSYLVGASPGALQPRIHAEVAAEPPQDGTPRCTVALCAERPPDMDDERWQRLVRCHEVEVLLIQARLARRRTAAA